MSDNFRTSKLTCYCAHTHPLMVDALKVTDNNDSRLTVQFLLVCFQFERGVVFGKDLHHYISLISAKKVMIQEI